MGKNVDDGLVGRMKGLYWKLRSRAYRQMLANKARRRGLSLRAFLWRRVLLRTTFIAVSGSVGKTTTKELLAEILQTHRPTSRTPGNWNTRKTRGVENAILRTRPWHRFAVIETGVEAPGEMRDAAAFVKPDIALMLEVKRCHTNAFKTLEAIAEEKSQLLKALGPRGYAVINQDNPHVVEMASNLHCRIIRFGTSEKADFRLRWAESRWPDRLRMQIEVDGAVHDVKTRLVGTHWAPAVLASLAAATACGVPLDKAIATLRSVEPFWARMQPLTVPSGGATVLRDEWNGSIDTFEPAFKVMEEARAERKIVVFSDFSDTMTKLRTRANQLGRRAAQIVEVAVFVGEYADRAAIAAEKAGLDPKNIHQFLSPPKAIEFLRSELREGDLVLIKGQSNHHLSRIYLGLLGDIACTRPTCSKQILCDRCPDLGLQWRPELRGLMGEPGSYL